MRQKHFRNKVGESSLTLPFMVFVTLLSCFLQHAFDSFYLWITLFAVGLLTYGMMEWNSQCQLLRVRSRMVSVTLLAFVAVFPRLQVISWCWLPALCLLLLYFVAFKGYGQLKPQGWVFYSFLFASVASVIFPPILLLIPFMYFAFSHQLRVLSGKSVVASLLGIAFPYWTYGILCLTTKWTLTFHQRIWSVTLDFHLPDYGVVQSWQWTLFTMLAVLGLISIVHFVRTSYNDKIRTRQFFYTILALQFPILFIVAWYPEAASITLPMLLLNTSPFIAHYFVLARGRSVDFCFAVTLLALVVAAVFLAIGRGFPDTATFIASIAEWFRGILPDVSFGFWPW